MVKPWQEYRQEITRLYIREGHTLTDVRKLMLERHNFSASIRSYRQHFDHWNLQKYNCKKREIRKAHLRQQQQQQQFDQPQRQEALLSPPRTPLTGSIIKVELSSHDVRNLMPPARSPARLEYPTSATVHPFFLGGNENIPPHEQKYFRNGMEGDENTPHHEQKYYRPSMNRFEPRRPLESPYGRLSQPLQSPWYPPYEPSDSDSSFDSTTSPVFHPASMAAGMGSRLLPRLVDNDTQRLMIQQ